MCSFLFTTPHIRSACPPTRQIRWPVPAWWPRTCADDAGRAQACSAAWPWTVLLRQGAGRGRRRRPDKEGHGEEDGYKGVLRRGMEGRMGIVGVLRRGMEGRMGIVGVLYTYE